MICKEQKEEHQVDEVLLIYLDKIDFIHVQHLDFWFPSMSIDISCLAQMLPQENVLGRKLAQP